MKKIFENWKNTLHEGELKYDKKMYKEMSKFVVDCYAHWVIQNTPNKDEMVSFIENPPQRGKFDEILDEVEETMKDYVSRDVYDFIRIYVHAQENPQFVKMFKQAYPVKRQRGDTYQVDFDWALGVREAFWNNLPNSPLKNKTYGMSAGMELSIEEIKKIIKAIEMTIDDIRLGFWAAEEYDLGEPEAKDLDHEIGYLQKIIKDYETSGFYEVSDIKVPYIDKNVTLHMKIEEKERTIPISWFTVIDGHKTELRNFELDKYDERESSLTRILEDDYILEMFADDAINYVINETNLYSTISDMMDTAEEINKHNGDPAGKKGETVESYNEYFIGDVDFEEEFLDETQQRKPKNKVKLKIYKSKESAYAHNPWMAKGGFLGFHSTGSSSFYNLIVLYFDENPTFVRNLSDILRTLRHELQHETQDLIRKLKNLKHDQGGLPSKYYEDWDEDSGEWKDEHPRRAVEFKPRLSDEIHNFTKRYIHNDNLLRFRQGGLERYTPQEQMEWIKESMLGYIGKREFFSALKRARDEYIECKKEGRQDCDPVKAQWYKKAVKEFSTIVLKRAANKIKELYG